MMFKSGRSGRFFRMALWASTVAFVAVVFNSYARLSEAGLGCPDWPGCYGVLFAPVTAQDVNRARTPEDMQKLEKKRAAQETTQRAYTVGGISDQAQMWVIIRALDLARRAALKQ